MDQNKLKSLLIPIDISIKNAMQKLNETSKKILFVVSKSKKLLGTVTDGDIRRGIINGVGFSDKVENIISRKYISVTHGKQEIKEDVKRLMIKREIEQVPVLDSNGKIIDVIFWTDILGEKETIQSRQFYSNQVIIMAGGKGTRLDPFTKILPKPLIPIGNKPVIELIMENFNNYGFSKFTFTLNYKKEYIKLFLKENNFTYSIDWVEEDEFMGTVGSISLLNDRIDDTFFVVNCDSLLDVDYVDVLKWHKEHNASITIIGCHNEIKIPFGVLEMSNGALKKIFEKPAHDVIINTGVYVMEPHIISYIQEGKQIDMNALIDLVADKEKITVYPITDGWFDMGQWEEYKKSVEKLGG